MWLNRSLFDLTFYSAGVLLALHIDEIYLIDGGVQNREELALQVDHGFGALSDL